MFRVFLTVRHMLLPRMPFSCCWFTVSINYKSFYPTGSALLTLTLPDYLRDNLRAFRNTKISGMTLRPLPKENPERPDYRAGNGPLAMAGTSVLVWGLPGKANASTLQELLSEYSLAEEDREAGPPISKVNM